MGWSGGYVSAEFAAYLEHVTESVRVKSGHPVQNPRHPRHGGPRTISLEGGNRSRRDRDGPVPPGPPWGFCAKKHVPDPSGLDRSRVSGTTPAHGGRGRGRRRKASGSHRDRNLPRAGRSGHRQGGAALYVFQRQPAVTIPARHELVGTRAVLDDIKGELR